MKAIIGAKSPLGKLFCSRTKFDYIIDSTNLDLLRNKQFQEIICTVADLPDYSSFNKDKDTQYISHLTDALSDAKTERFTLVTPMGILNPGTNATVNESSPVHTPESCQNVFLTNRAEFDTFVNLRFGRVLNIRMPQGIFDDQCQTGILKDIMENKDISDSPANAIHQYYHLKRLCDDIKYAWTLGFSHLNMATEPITTMDLVRQFKPESISAIKSTEEALNTTVLQSLHSIHWRNKEGYLYGKGKLLKEMRPYVESVLGETTPVLETVAVEEE